MNAAMNAVRAAKPERAVFSVILTEYCFFIIDPLCCENAPIIDLKHSKIKRKVLPAERFTYFGDCNILIIDGTGGSYRDTDSVERWGDRLWKIKDLFWL